jgi:hypothetical protein
VITRKHSTFKHVCLLVLVVGLGGAIGLAYPPDNAAVLYYKTCLEYQKLDGDLKKELPAVATGKAEPSQAMRKYIKGQADRIKTLADAARIKACDWGYDYSKGFDMVLAPLGDMRTLARIVLADANIRLEDGDWQGGLERCRIAYGMARHVKTDSVLVCNLVGIAIEDITNQVMTRLLSKTSEDTEALTQARRLLEQVAQENPRMKLCLEHEALMVSQYKDVAAFQEAVNAAAGPGEEVLTLDEATLTKGIDYYRNQMKRMSEAFDLDYVKAITTMEELEKQIEADALRLPWAKPTQNLVPAVAKCFSAETRGRTDINVLRAATAVYLATAQQGRLPRQLPKGLPQDLFSDKDFAYQVTDAGFTLRCQGKDLGKDTVHEYPFGVTK